jgi:hypothetical protein
MFGMREFRYNNWIVACKWDNRQNNKSNYSCVSCNHYENELIIDIKKSCILVCE